MATIYWFCRTTDDIGDEGPGGPDDTLAELDAFEEALSRAVDGGDAEPGLVATADVVTVAPLRGAGGIATNGTDTVWVAGGNGIESISTSAPYTVTSIHDAAATGAGSFADGAPGVATFDDVRGLAWAGGLLWSVDTNAAVIRSVVERL